MRSWEEAERDFKKFRWKEGFNRFDRFGNAVVISMVVAVVALGLAFGWQGVAAAVGSFAILNAIRLGGRWTR